jgi:hypothetical protein
MIRGKLSLNDIEERIFMHEKNIGPALTVGILLCIGLLGLGFILANGAMRIKDLNRTVVVKGLSEREAPADIAIWPIQFSVAENDLETLYRNIQYKTDRVVAFLKANGFSPEEISISIPSITDHQAMNYNQAQIAFRYTANASVTLYSNQVDKVRQTMGKVLDLLKEDIAISGEGYENRTEFIFTKLNDLKPSMIQEATKNAREVADKFAQDSNSKLGKIKQADQGLFTIRDRDSGTPHIKVVRVVSTVEYHLSD